MASGRTSTLQISRLRPAEVIIPELASGQPHDIAVRLKERGVQAITPRAGLQIHAVGRRLFYRRIASKIYRRI